MAASAPSDARRPRVAVVGRYYNTQGGVSNVMAQLATRAARSGRYDVTVVSHEYLDWDEDAGMSRLPARMLERPALAQLPSFALVAGRAVARGGFDLVHAHDPQILRADLFTAHSCFSAYIKGQRATADPLRRWGSRAHPRHVIGIENERLAYRPGKGEVVAVSGSVAEQIVDLYLPPEQVSFVHNGVDVERFGGVDREAALAELEARVGEPLGDVLKLVFVGYEFSRKRLDVAIRGLAGMGDDTARLIVAGGADRTPYETLANELGVRERVHFLGHTANVERVLAACDVFVFPTKYEAASLAVLEALAAGLAIVTTDVAMAQEVLRDDETALLLPNTDDAGPATAALSRLASEPGLVARLGQAATALSTQHTWDAVWERYDAIYARLLDAKGVLT